MLEVVHEEALILRRALRMERVFQDRYDPFAFSDDRLYEHVDFRGLGYATFVNYLAPEFRPALQEARH